MPLVRDLFCRKNGLLFTYGIANSGKTYMSGEPDNPGILLRSLDIIFNSIAGLQAPAFVFKPDKTNGFEVQSEGDAEVEAGKFKPKKISAKARSEMPEYSDSVRLPEVRKVDCTVDEDNNYSVFVSYVDFYKNKKIDLLEDIPADSKKPPQSKSMREDARRQMYVSGVTEVEVKSTEEAYEALRRGQRRRGAGRSHESSSVLTIRLVWAPLNIEGDEVVQDKGEVRVAQLVLVDLAAASTGNQAADLIVLRACMATLRDNQRAHAANKIVPYRDVKLTHLFKNYLVCVSARPEDHDETIHAMQFAENTREVQLPVTNPQSPATFTPGRRRANLLHKAALKKNCIESPLLHSSGDSEKPKESQRKQAATCCLLQENNTLRAQVAALKQELKAKDEQIILLLQMDAMRFAEKTIVVNSTVDQTAKKEVPADFPPRKTKNGYNRGQQQSNWTWCAPLPPNSCPTQCRRGRNVMS